MISQCYKYAYSRWVLPLTRDKCYNAPEAHAIHYRWACKYTYHCKRSCHLLTDFSAKYIMRVPNSLAKWENSQHSWWWEKVAGFPKSTWCMYLYWSMCGRRAHVEIFWHTDIHHQSIPMSFFFVDMCILFQKKKSDLVYLLFGTAFVDGACTFKDQMICLPSDSSLLYWDRKWWSNANLGNTRVTFCAP